VKNHGVSQLSATCPQPQVEHSGDAEKAKNRVREELRAKRQNDTRFEPKMTPQERAERRGRWQRAVERAKNWNA
jgi:glycerol kinase